MALIKRASVASKNVSVFYSLKRPTFEAFQVLEISQKSCEKSVLSPLSYSLVHI